MKKILSSLVILIMTIITSTAFGEARITGVTNDGGAPITSSVPGSIIRVEGNGFGHFKWYKILNLEFTEPEAFSVDLEVLDWSNTNIRAHVPSSLTDYLSEGAIVGELKIIRTDVFSGERELFSNEDVGLTINRLEFRTPSAEVTMMPPSTEEEPEFRTAPRPLTVMHKDDVNIQAAEPSREVTITPQEEVKIEAKPPTYEVLRNPEITRVIPDVAPPGSQIRIEGRYFYDQGDKVVSIYFTHPTVSRSFYMDLEVISWGTNGILARIPDLNSQMFRFSAPLSVKKSLAGLLSSRRAYVPYGTYEYLSPDGREELSTYTDGQIRIITMPDTLISNTVPFRLAP